MKETEIIQGNKLIAEFMGYTLVEREGLPVIKYWRLGIWKEEYRGVKGTFKCFLDPDYAAKIFLPFHSSWDWLMPVVEKIWKMGKMISIIYYTEGGGIVDGKIYNWGLGDPYQNCDGKEPITVVWKTVVQFITWYNSQPPSKVG